MTPVIQVPNELLAQSRGLPEPKASARRQLHGYRSLVHAAIGAVLREAGQEPSRFHSGMRSAGEIVHIAAREFIRSVGATTKRHFSFSDLFDRFYVISSMLYGGAKGVGQLLLASSDSSTLQFVVRFREAVPFSEPRWPGRYCGWRPRPSLQTPTTSTEWGD